MDDESQYPDIIPFPTESVLTPQQAKPVRLGMLAGSGQFPIQFVQSAQQRGHSVFGLGIRGMADESLAAVCDDFRFNPLGRISRAIRLFRKAGAERIVVAGKIEKTVLFHSFRLLRLMPDWRTIRMWIRYVKRKRKHDSIMLAVIREFEKDGFQFDSALDYAPELIVKHGFLTKRKPTLEQWRDIQTGWELARELGRLDVGQTVVVNDTDVIAVEAIEGTDPCIERAGNLCRRGGFTVVKVGRPQQDLRFDLPTIGLETIKLIHQFGGRVLAIEAGATVIIEPEAVASLAEKFGIAIVAVNAEELTLRAVA